MKASKKKFDKEAAYKKRKAGNSKVTIRQIAEKLSLSPAAVSMAFNEYKGGVGAQTRDEILRTARQLGYKARSRKKWYPRAIPAAFVTAAAEYLNDTNTFFARVYNIAARIGIEKNIYFILFGLNPSAPAAETERKIRELQTLGIGMCVTHIPEIAVLLRRSGFTVLLAETYSEPEDLHSVVCDDYRAGRIAAQHALDLGHTRTGLFCPYPDTDDLRVKGFLDAYSEAGFPVPAEDQWAIPTEHESLMVFLSKKCAEYTQEKMPTFFYSPSDNYLFIAFKIFKRYGFAVPERVSFIGTDDMYWGQYADPAFTTVNLNEPLFAEKLLELIIDAHAGKAPYRITIPVRLIERESAVRAPGKN